MSPARKSFLLGAATATTILSFAGACSGSDDEPRVVTKTETRTVTKPVKVPSVPDACKVALSQAGDIDTYSSHLSSAGDKQLEIMERMRLAIYEKDTAAINRLDEEQRALKTETIEGTAQLVSIRSQFEYSSKACSDAIR